MTTFICLRPTFNYEQGVRRALLQEGVDLLALKGGGRVPEEALKRAGVVYRPGTPETRGTLRWESEERRSQPWVRNA